MVLVIGPLILHVSRQKPCMVILELAYLKCFGFGLRVFQYSCIHVDMCVCMYACIWMYACMLCIYVRAWAWSSCNLPIWSALALAFMYFNTCVCIRVCMHAYEWMYVCVYACMYVILRQTPCMVILKLAYLKCFGFGLPVFNIHVCMCVYMHACECMYVRTYACMLCYVCPCMDIRISMHACACTCTCTHVYNKSTP
jgi:hypothetical protein